VYLSIYFHVCEIFPSRKKIFGRKTGPVDIFVVSEQNFNSKKQVFSASLNVPYLSQFLKWRPPFPALLAGCRNPEMACPPWSSSPLSQGKPRGKASRLTQGMLPENKHYNQLGRNKKSVLIQNS
jgi:hypothetical protein